MKYKKDKKGRVGFRFPFHLIEAIKERAAEEGIPVSEYVRMQLEKDIK